MDIDELLEKLESETKRLRTFNDIRELKEARKGLVKPSPYYGLPDGSERRTMNLGDADKKFLAYVRGQIGPSEMKELVEDATGQYLVSPVITTEIERVVEKLVTIRPLASQRTINKDRIQVRAMDEVTMAWGKIEIAMAPDITDSAPTPVLPVDKYVEDLYGLAKIGEDELMDSDIDLAIYLSDSFGRAIAETENAAFIKGAGHASEEPDGITLDATLVGATLETAEIGVVTVEDFLQCIYAVPAVYRKGSTWIVNSLTELELRKLRTSLSVVAGEAEVSGQGSYLWQPSLIAGAPPTFLGYPILTDDNMEHLGGTAECIAIFGNFQRGYRILDRQGMTVQRLSELYAIQGMVGFKCHARVGGYLIKPSNKALVLLTEAAA